MALVFLHCRTPEVRPPPNDLSLLVERAASRQPEDKLTTELSSRLVITGSNTVLRVLVDMSEQLDLDRVAERVADKPRRERRELVVGALEDLARRSQKRLHPLLDGLQKRGAVEGYKGFAVINRLLVSGTPEAVRTLASRDEIAAIDLETEIHQPLRFNVEPGPWPDASPGQTAREKSSRSSWAIEYMGAPEAWQRGITGRGVVVGIIDTGASPVHEQLRENFRGGDDSWHDPWGEHANPSDSGSAHGTQVLSAAVGQNKGGVTTGIAPGALWIACAAFANQRYSDVRMTECADWILRVGKPDVLIGAWLLPHQGGNCNPELHRIVSAWRAAEIFPVFAAGNLGPDPGTDGSPANYVDLAPDGGSAFAVGGVGQDGSVYPNSSRGPNSCDGSSYPTIAVPAENIHVAMALGPKMYLRSRGTSIGAGLAAGAIALLIEHRPRATVSQLHEALLSGAIDVGGPGTDNTFGHGRLSIPRALEALARLSATS